MGVGAAVGSDCGVVADFLPDSIVTYNGNTDKDGKITAKSLASKPGTKGASLRKSTGAHSKGTDDRGNVLGGALTVKKLTEIDTDGRRD